MMRMMIVMMMGVMIMSGPTYVNIGFESYSLLIMRSNRDPHPDPAASQIQTQDLLFSETGHPNNTKSASKVSTTLEATFRLLLKCLGGNVDTSGIVLGATPAAPFWGQVWPAIPIPRTTFLGFILVHGCDWAPGTKNSFAGLNM